MNALTERVARKGNFITNMKVKIKILAGFSTVLAVLVIISGIGYFSFTSVNKDVTAYTKNVEISTVTNEIETQFLLLHGNVREFAASADEKFAREAEGVLVKLESSIKHADQIFSGEHKVQLEKIKKALEIYKKDFVVSEELAKEYNHLVNDILNPSAKKFIADLKEIQKEVIAEGKGDPRTYAGIAMRRVLALQVSANATLARYDDQSYQSAQDDFMRLEVLLGSLKKTATTPHEQELIAESKDLLEKYKTSFEAAVEDSKKIHHLVEGEIAQAGRDIIAAAETLKKNAAELEVQIRQSTTENIIAAEVEMLAISAIGIGVGLLLAWLLGNGIANPVVGMTGAMRRLADGDLETEIPAQGRGDEIGQMAQTVQVFKDNAIRVKQMEAEQKEAEKRAEEEKRRMMHAMADDFESSVGGIVQTVSSASTELQSSAQSMATVSEQTSSQATTVAAASEEAATNVQTVASAAEELSSSISEISRQVSQSTQIANTAVSEVDGANKKVQGLAEAANKIGEVVALITDIADQTNLLALNATIEAARAGEAGKGFAVVASEVKNLANQTAKATEEIGIQISGIQGATQDAVGAIDSIGSVIGEMSEIAGAIAAAVEEQGAATQEIARNVEQAAAGTSEVTSNISKVTEASSQTGDAASQVLSAAGELSRQSETLRSEVDKFLDQIRKS
ncbi:HAMP domain-containing methyl-accepting chemotaxis protein [Varunaivibrio sulfuroxidans]|uniref:Methyl-accepting chemotaxis protein n=1 Tax=Varunaivibrio sulfuroxidans TaxID=1773489 RepID=A0A4R3JAX2_9PROT|nr:methyl-accepting chemotaxis protein [Varunaivibrio sulfuroxidans]TCS62495.1 methyl-accepting chemotaxis protein [Varunaivibrio sulfuroxidans]WES30833.1 methyl-accepting chemotaxis protein [Varunaivibrio sulfuroxidans]